MSARAAKFVVTVTMARSYQSAAGYGRRGTGARKAFNCKGRKTLAKIPKASSTQFCCCDPVSGISDDAKALLQRSPRTRKVRQEQLGRRSSSETPGEFLADLLPLGNALLQFGTIVIEFASEAGALFGAYERLQ